MLTFTPEHWKDYELLDCGNFEKLERFGSVILRRPEPQALWDKVWDEIEWKKLTDITFKQKGIDIVKKASLDRILKAVAVAKMDYDTRAEITLIKREEKEYKTALSIIRIGTCGILQAEIPVHSYILSTHAFGFDNVAHFYNIAFNQEELELKNALQNHLNLPTTIQPYLISASPRLTSLLDSSETHKGITVTSSGFYGPQGRIVRLGIQDPELNAKMDSFNFNGTRMTNLEMETGAIYGLGKLLGHNCLSLNAIIANRATGTFSEDPYKAVDELIEYTLNKLAE